MIKCEGPHIQMRGNAMELCIEYMEITHSMFEMLQNAGRSYEEAKEMILDMVGEASKTDEEIEQEADEEFGDNEEYGQMLKAMLDGIFKGKK